MIVTAHRSQRRGRSTSALLAALLVVSVLLIPPAASSHTAAAAQYLSRSVATAPTPVASVRPDVDAYPLRIEIITLAPQVLTTQANQSVTLTLLNEGPTPITNARLGLIVSERPLNTAAGLDAWLTAGATDSSGVPVDSIDITETLEPGIPVTLTVQVPAVHLGARPGQADDVIRGLGIEAIGRKTENGQRVRVGMERTVAMSANDADRPVANLSVILPITGPLARPDDPELEAAGLNPLLKPGGHLSQRLDLISQAPQLTPALDATLLNRVRAFDPPLGDWSDDLTEAIAGREVIVLPRYDADVTTLLKAGPGGQTLLSQALEHPGSYQLQSPIVTNVALLEGDELTKATTDGIGQGGIDWVVSEHESTHPEVVSNDPGLAGLLFDDLVEVLPAQRQQELMARGLLYSKSSMVSSGVYGIGREETVDAAELTTRLAWLEASPWLVFDGLTGALNNSDGGAELTSAELEGALGTDSSEADDPAAPDEEPAPPAKPLSNSKINEITTRLANVELIADLTAEPELISQRMDALIFPALAWAGRYETAGRAAVLSAGLAEAESTINAVNLVPGSVLNLISRSGEVPIPLSNGLSQDITVQVVLEPNHPRLKVKGPVTLTIPMRSTATALIPVEAVGSGDVEVTVSLLNTTGTTVLVTDPITVRVRADWENVGTVAIAIVLSAGLIFGIFRTARRGRSRHRISSVPVGQFSPEESGDPSTGGDT